ncbi:alpha/beta fold hydrolase [Melissospora conviva]|uniref:alpha/beta fold hydrolase n=1 Tax=Melissospora conviva TaxID=3388432 RepID=UPI003B8034B8
MSFPLPAALRRALAPSNGSGARRRLLLLGVVVVLLAAAVTWAVWPSSQPWRAESARVTVLSGPDGTEPVELDTTLYLPAGASAADPVPAVLLAHGFGGSKESVSADAESFAERGYAVLAYTARGFGLSGGQIHLDHPEHEVRDAQRLLDWLAQRPEIRTDGAGDPRVGVVGASYGGALALLLAAADQRVDAIVPMITWNDLSTALLPESSGGDATGGVFKKGWAGIFFGNGGLATGLTGAAALPAAAGAPGMTLDPSCGRFAPDICAAYLRIAAGGQADAEAVARLKESSPAPVLDRIKSPTLLIQGTADSLFTLAEAEANARGIAATGTPVRVAWYNGGHDGGDGPQNDSDRIRALTAQWLDHYVKGEGPAPADSFTWSRVSGFNAMDRGLVATGFQADDYPGLGGESTLAVPVAGPPQPVANPPGGNPAAVSSVPGAGALSSLAAGFGGDIPGQHAIFQSEPLAESVDVVGAPTVSVRAASPTGEATLFVKLYDAGPGGNATLPGGLVAPVRLTGLPADIAEAEPVQVTLPAVVHRFESGHRLRLVVATSDQGYAGPTDPTVYTIAAGDGPVVLPTVVGTPIPTEAALWRWVLIGLVAAIVAGLVVVVAVLRRRHRRHDASVDPRYAGVPLVVRNLRKAYDDGFVAVSDVDFEVHPGQVVGLLGPNGAGKTTTLRVLMGLTQPSGGEIFVFGHPLVPGSPVLSRIGALVEGPGFLPHLSGLENLKAYWRATGRPWDDAHFDEALEIAGLGDSVHRKIRNYSHGMRQRLAIAQAMLGLPELLVLDEPTDGLDPPQIAEMRRVLKRYATDGRAVLVSSHLLAEVEQTCTHVVVVNKGAIVANGEVDEIVGESPSVLFDVDDPVAARAVIDKIDGVRLLPEPGGALVVDTDGVPRREVVAELVRAGIGVERVVPRRRLEDAFLALVGESSRGSGDR